MIVARCHSNPANIAITWYLNSNNGNLKLNCAKLYAVSYHKLSYLTLFLCHSDIKHFPSQRSLRQTPVIVYLTYDLPICKETIVHPSYWPMTAQGSVTGFDILQQEPVLTNAMWPNRRNIFDLQQDGCEIDEILSGFIWTIYTSQTSQILSSAISSQVNS